MRRSRLVKCGRQDQRSARQRASAVGVQHGSSSNQNSLLRLDCGQQLTFNSVDYVSDVLREDNQSGNFIPAPLDVAFKSS